VLFALIGFIVAYQFVNPAPPDQIALGTGRPEGNYYALGQAYHKILARDKIKVDVRSTSGSIENIGLLQTDSDGVDVAFIQGGTGGSVAADRLISLGSLYFEPLWLFYRKDIDLNHLTDLKDQRIAVGPDGSGTQALARQLLELNTLTAESINLLPAGGEEAAAMLLQGDLDAAFFVIAASSPVVNTLLRSEAVALFSFDRAAAYTRHFQFLSAVTLPEGVIDFSQNIPTRDTTLLAAATNLVARRDLHPALIDLLLQAAQEVHGQGGLFEKSHQFPSPQHIEFDLSKESRRFYASGPPFLQRYLPFWAATLVDRLKVMLLPLVALLLPLFRIMPPLYRWRVRSRIYRWYSELATVDPESYNHLSGEKLKKNLAELNRIEDEVSKVTIPLSYSVELYELRLHLEYLRYKLRQIQAKADGKTLTPEA
jgi:TRAP transporter TAXI family solute receptor